ncbi:unnamed protein product, partial [Polarella glacialis]
MQWLAWFTGNSWLLRRHAFFSRIFLIWMLSCPPLWGRSAIAADGTEVSGSSPSTGLGLRRTAASEGKTFATENEAATGPRPASDDSFREAPDTAQGASPRQLGQTSCPRSQWVDPDTPAAACRLQTDSAGEPLELIFSDEFNVPGRTFADGQDPVWTAITGFPATNDQLNAYDDSAERATTYDGKLLLRISNSLSTLNVVNATSGKTRQLKRPYTSAMLQSWNKFCFTGGVVEISAKFPGKPEQPGLWPAFWLMGNLGRATFQESTDNIWPFTYSQCPTGGEAEQEANQFPRKQQRINKCLGENWTARFGLNPNQGRGALEIDIIEVLPGSHKADYKSEKVDPGFCPAQPLDV